MYTNNYGYNNYQPDIYTPAIDTNNNERFAGGIVAPLLLGGVAGYAIGQNNNRPYFYYTQPYFYPPYRPYRYYR